MLDRKADDNSRMRILSILLVLIAVSGCNKTIVLEDLDSGLINAAPTSNDISSSVFEDTQSIVTLSYTDTESDLATVCAITDPTNVTVTQACVCSAGVCTVGVTGTANYNGAASFNYTVTANAVVSNSASATLTINAVDDAPVASNISHVDTIHSIETFITLSYTDNESDLATSCSISNLVNVTVSTACSCNGLGTCSVGVTSAAVGAASFDYTVTANSATSNTASASYNSIKAPFVSVWRTTTPNETVTLPLRSGFTYNFTVDWGDGSSSTVTAWDDVDKVHTYVNAQDYTVTISGTMQTIFFNNSGDKLKIRSIPNLGEVGWTSFDSAFYGCSNLGTVSGGDTSAVTNMAAMFRSASLAKPDTSGWVTSNVTNMSYMFSYASVATPDTSGWITSSVTNMSFMFNFALIATPNTSSWNTANVTTMDSIFKYAGAANPDTSGWDTSKVTIMSNMFVSTGTANPNTSSWDTSKVTTMYAMFSYSNSANPDTSGWNTSNVTSTAYMFFGAIVANPDVRNWDTTKLFHANNMFQDAPAANPDMSTWNFVTVANMTGIFTGKTLPTATYSSFLNRVYATTGRINVTIGGGGSKYNAGASAARAGLVSAGWIITDGGAE